MVRLPLRFLKGKKTIDINKTILELENFALDLCRRNGISKVNSKFKVMLERVFTQARDQKHDAIERRQNLAREAKALHTGTSPRSRKFNAFMTRMTQGVQEKAEEKGCPLPVWHAEQLAYSLLAIYLDEQARIAV